MTDRNPCREHRCHICCLDTRMTLTEDDVRRLEAAGHRDFCRVNDDGDLELVNRGGRCVFLADGRCRVYDLRPEGCRLYPLVLNLPSGRVVRDELCPHRLEFPVTGERAARLRRSVELERDEAARRRWRFSG